MIKDMDKYHRMYGRHSNIPDCCIEFFIRKWPNMNYAGEDHGYHKIRKIAEQKMGKWWGYIPCPDCLDNTRWHKIHHCRRGECDHVQTELKEETGYTFPYDKYESIKQPRK